MLARWGGEEFLLLLPNTDQDVAMLVLERVQRALVDMPLKTADAMLHVTFSAGLALMSPGETVAFAVGVEIAIVGGLDGVGPGPAMSSRDPRDVRSFFPPHVLPLRWCANRLPVDDQPKMP